MEYEVVYDSLEQLTEAMAAAEILGLEYRARTTHVTSELTHMVFKKYVITLLIDKE